MTYELRKLENEKYKCPKCGGRTVKFGTPKGRKRRLCQDCNNQYFPDKITQIRVGIEGERSIIVEIYKLYDEITSSDIQIKLPANKHIIGWCKLEKSLST